MTFSEARIARQGTEEVEIYIVQKAKYFFYFGGGGKYRQVVGTERRNSLQLGVKHFSDGGWGGK